MSAKHTPGPWVVKFRNDHSAYISFGDPAEGEHKQFDIEFDDRYPSDVADARLISAAPELLSELQDILRSIKGGGRVVTFGDCDIERYEAAIAKATGEQP